MSDLSVRLFVCSNFSKIHQPIVGRFRFIQVCVRIRQTDFKESGKKVTITFDTYIIIRKESLLSAELMNGGGI